MSDTELKEEEPPTQSPLLRCADLRHTVSLPNGDKDAARTELLELITKHNMLAFYQMVWKEQGLPLDQGLVAGMEEANKAKLQELDAKIVDADENLGEIDVRDAKLERAKFLSLTGSKDEAVAAWEVDGITTGPKIDIELAVLRIALTYDDQVLFKKRAEIAQKLIDDGGDWDRRNRLFCYRATHDMRARNFPEAAQLLLKSIATFSAHELYPYASFVFYTVLSSIISLDRVELKKKVVDSPEILQVVEDIPHLKPLLNSLYDTDYGLFFRSLVGIMPAIRADRYLCHHASYFMREARLVAFRQFLTAYRSVTLASMAQAFGVSVPFLDRELSSFIAVSRLDCKIDKVGGIVETVRHDKRNAEYHNVIKRGDALLNRIQKLSKVITI